MSRILVVDDDHQVRRSIAKILAHEGHEIEEWASGEEALRALEKSIFDLVVCDLRMQAIDGMEVLRRSKASHPDTQVVLMTAYGTIDSAVKAMREGSYDYITKPIKPEELSFIVAKALENRAIRYENRQLKRLVKDKFGFHKIIAINPVVVALLRTAAAVADTETNILITGDSGSGKELIAGAIHFHSAYRQFPFVTVNCGAIPEHLLESELFGHVKGAFTGAIDNKRGLVEEANKGTLFLDEIGEMSPPMQVKLLRFLESGEFRRVGETQTRFVKVRLISATNIHLERAMKAGTFREDLYYRINVIHLHLPPLRERRDDIPSLSNYHLRMFAEKMHKNVTGISKEAMSLLVQNDWPGNVRELVNTIEHGVALSSGEIIEVKDLPPRFTATNGKARSPIAEGTLEEIEKGYIIKVLHDVNWHQAEACKILGVSKTTLYRRLKEYGIHTRLISEALSN